MEANRPGNEVPMANISAPIDIAHYVRLFLRRRWVILGTAISITLLAFVYAWRQPRIYAATASIIIEASAPKFLDSEVQDVSEQSAAAYWYNKEYFETQFKVITSRAVSSRVVEKLGLQSDANFLDLDRISDPKKRAEQMKKADAVEMLRSMVRVKPERETRLVQVGVEDRDPERAALLANEITEAFIQENLALRLRTTETASEWLEDRLSDLERKSKASELAVYDFKKDADMLTTSLEDRQSIVSQRLNAYNQALTETRTKIAALRARVAAAEALKESSANADEMWAAALPAASSSQLIEDLKSKLATQRVECAQLKERYLEHHPTLMACQDKLVSLREDLLKELRRIIQTSRVELSEEQTRERNLNALLNEAKEEAFVVNKKQIEFERLKRDSENNRRLYDLVLKRLKDIELSGLLRTSNVRILDPARPSFQRVRPRILFASTIAFFLGVFAGVGVALLLEMMDNTIASQLDVEGRLGLSYLGFAPLIRGKKGERVDSLDLFTFHQPRSAMAECTRAIRTNLLFMTPGKPLKRLLITSSSPREGKSTTVINLGVAMAQNGERVLVVDTDMRKPRLHRAFGVPNDVGVSSLIVGEGELSSAIKSTEVPNLFVLPCGPIPPNPAELLHTEAFASLLKRMSADFDRVILDSPPLGAVADAAVLGTVSDGVVLVLHVGGTGRALAQQAVKRMKDVNAPVLGAILNELDVEDPKYGAYYAGYAHYGSYYGEKTDGRVA